MNIAVMSPHCHGNGTTTVAALLASSMAKQTCKVCLTHVTGRSEALYPYYGLKSGGAEDVDAVQLTKLIRTGGMQKNSFSTYCRDLANGLDLFSLDSDTPISDEEMSDVIHYIATSTPYDYTFFDVDENSLDKANVKTVIKEADCILLVLSQATTEVNRFIKMMRTFLSRTTGKPIIVIVNKYRNVLGTVKDLGHYMGVKDTSHWHAVHDNPFVLLCENKGQLKYLAEQIRLKNGDVMELDMDIQHIVRDIIETKRTLSQRKNKSEEE